MTIPYTLHQIWVGPDPLPAEYAAYAEGWRQLHPDWEHRLWTNDNLPAMRNRELYGNPTKWVPPASVGQFRADLLRYEVLWRYGGVYVDADFECLGNIEHLLSSDEVDEARAFAAWEVQDEWIANGLMGATPGHEFIDRLIEGLHLSVIKHRGQRPNRSSGPQYLTRLYRQYPWELAVLDSKYFYPYLYSDVGTPRERPPWPEGTLAVHHWNNRRRMIARGRR